MARRTTKAQKRIIDIVNAPLGYIMPERDRYQDPANRTVNASTINALIEGGHLLRARTAYSARRRKRSSRRGGPRCFCQAPDNKKGQLCRRRRFRAKGTNQMSPLAPSAATARSSEWRHDLL
jgi:hypothetical protein